MATYSTNEFKSGMKVLLEGDPCSIVENEFVKPGKGQAFNRVRPYPIKRLPFSRFHEFIFNDTAGVTLQQHFHARFKFIRRISRHEVIP